MTEGERRGGERPLLVGVDTLAPVVVGGGDAVLEGVLDITRRKEIGEWYLGNCQLSLEFMFLPNQKELWRMESSLVGGE